MHLTVFERALLTSGLKESQLDTIPLSLSLSTFLIILKFLYTGQIQLSTAENVEDLLAVSNLYMLEDLKNACEQQLAELISPESVQYLLRLADLYDLAKLRQRCTQESYVMMEE